MNTGNGWQCTGCGQWIYSGTYHVCSGPINPAGPSYQPGSISLPACRAPWQLLTADAVRLIIREELERARNAEGKQVSET